MTHFSKLLTALILTSIFAFVALADEPTSKTTEKEKITWHKYDEGLKVAKKENKHVFVDFYTNWCGYCKKMDRETFTESEVIKMFGDNFIAVKVNAESQDTLDIDGFRITEQNLSSKEFGVKGYPTFWFLKPDGTKLGAISGYRPANVMMDALKYIHSEAYDTTKSSGK